MSGVYYLIINLTQDLIVDVGRLGSIGFLKGIYVYVGSGRGPGGILKRISRHMSKNKKAFWHIDYLTNNDYVDFINAIAITNKISNEQLLVRLISSDECFKPTMNGFGCSDFRGDRTHLFRFVCNYDVTNYLISRLVNTGIPLNEINLIVKD